MIEVKNVTKRFKGTEVLKKVDLYIQQGKICGLTGYNGSGKTVLMKIICGFIKPDEGEVKVNGKKIGTDCDFPENVGIIIETPKFSPYSSGFKNLKNLASIRKEISDKKIKEAMQIVGLNPEDKKWVSKYSLGMRQRLGIAQAVMEDQKILILDEPMNGLDKKGVEEMRKLFLNLKQQGVTMLLTSHNREDIDILADEVYEMDAGRLKMVRGAAREL